MDGRRLPTGWHRDYIRDELQLEPGDYGDHQGVWHIFLPNGGSGVLSPSHTVTEHEDGTITVYPSIKDKETGWHGHLDHGKWSEVVNA